jgi:hypothetical protein
LSRRPAFDDAALVRAIGPRRPAGFTREDRVRLIGEAAQALLEGREPGKAAALFLGGALAGWLSDGGDLVKDYFKIVRPKSHDTVQRVWARIAAHQDERRDDDGSL